MNTATYGSLPSDACTLGTAGSYGADRIVKKSYDNVGRVNLVQTGYGVTGVQADEVTTTYTDNGQTASVTDAEGNKTSYFYDGFDRLYQTQFPSATKGLSRSFRGTSREVTMYYTRTRVARILERFLDGSADSREFDDFISSRCDDPLVEEIRIRVARLPEEEPSEDANTYANAVAAETVRNLIARLREGAG